MTDHGTHRPDVDPASLGSFLQEFRPRLRRMVATRIDPRLTGRVDPSDVLQEAFVDVTRRLEEYRHAPGVPFFVWVRFLTGQKLLEFHRRHLGAAKRDVRREVAANRRVPEAATGTLVGLLLDGGIVKTYAQK